MYLNTSPASPASLASPTAYKGILKHACGAGKVCKNASPKDVFKYFPGFSDATEVYLNTSPAPEKYFYIYNYLIPLRCRRSLESIYIHLSGAGDVFIYDLQRKPKILYLQNQSKSRSNSGLRSNYGVKVEFWVKVKFWAKVEF